MIGNAYTSHVGERPLFFHVTDADVTDVEAVLVDEHGARHDMIEFEETRPDGRIVEASDGSRRVADVDDLLDAADQVLRESRWGRRVGARIPFAFWAEGTYRVEWSVSGVVEAVYTITVLPHLTITVIENGVEMERLRVTADEQRRLLALPSHERHAVLEAFTPKGS